MYGIPSHLFVCADPSDLLGARSLPEFEGGPIIVRNHLGIRNLRLEEGHVHPALFCVKCRQQSMLRSRRLFPELSISTVGKGLILLLDQLVLLEDAQFGPSLAWLSVQGRVCGFLQYYWGDSLIKARTKRWNDQLNYCGRRGLLFYCRARRWNCLWPLSVQMEFFWWYLCYRWRWLLSRPFFLRDLWCDSWLHHHRGDLLFHFNQGVKHPHSLVGKFFDFGLGLMNIRDVFFFHPHFWNDPAWIIVPWETHKEFHFFQHFVSFFPDASTIADERSNMPLDSQLLLLLQGNKMNVIWIHDLSYIL